MTNERGPVQRHTIDTRKFEDLSDAEKIERLREEVRNLRRVLHSANRVGWEVRSLLGMHRHGDDGVVLYPQHAIDRNTIGGAEAGSSLDPLA